MGKVETKHRIISGIVFVVYIMMLVYFMFFADSLGRNQGLANYHYNIIPFKEIMRFMRYHRILGMKAVLANLLGNVIAFIPFGVFLSALSNHRFNWKEMMFLSMDLSLAIEVLQLISKVGSFDIDDIILNTLGGVAGYFIFLMMMKKRKKNEE
ncbi:MAG: VanZ family protein [Lachnospiraceae bacterium]